MNTIALNNQEFQNKIVQIYKEEQFKIIEEKWNNFNKSEKLFVIEFLNEYYSTKKVKINESKWYNTVGDVVGIFDPTGAVDAINAISYFKQGDTLFGIMSLISAVPYIGDVVGKPIVLSLKAGGKAAKLMRHAKGPTQWAQLGRKFPRIKELLKSMTKIGPALEKIIVKIPGGSAFTKVIRDWVNMFKSAATVGKTTKLASGASKLTSTELKMFRNYGLKDYKGFMRLWKKGGFVKNRQLSKLLAKSKWWLGFLDFAGLANFVGPEEIDSQMPEGTYNAKMEEYMNSPESQKMWDEEMSQIPDQPDQQTASAETEQQPKAKSGFSEDPLMSLFFG